MEIKTLYKRTATGAVQQWWQEIEGNKYRTCSGQVGGIIVTSEWTHCSGKNLGRANATTPESQAMGEVVSNYKRKRKDGYVETIEEALSSARFSPMLAKSFDDYADTVFGRSTVWSQPKLDGIRVLAMAEGLFSRKGDRIVALPHIEKALRPVFRKHPNLIFDGEAYSHDLRDNFNAITSLVRKTTGLKPEDITASEQLQYWVYDCFLPEYPDLPFPVRMEHYLAHIHSIGSSHIVPVHTTAVQDPHTLDALYAEYLDAGYEGQMIRDPLSPYEQKRSKALLKRKEFEDSEFEVLDILEGVGNASGGAKVAWFRLDTDPSKSFKADVVGTREERAAILANRDQLIGKQATIKYFKQRTPDGIPRFGKVKLFCLLDRW